jgi:hypothetical protein
MTNTSPVEVAVRRPIASVKTSMAVETDASMRDIECLRGIGKTPGQLYILSQQCQACFQTIHTYPCRSSPGFRPARSGKDICDQREDRIWKLYGQGYSSTITSETGGKAIYGLKVEAFDGSTCNPTGVAVLACASSRASNSILARRLTPLPLTS